MLERDPFLLGGRRKLLALRRAVVTPPVQFPSVWTTDFEIQFGFIASTSFQTWGGREMDLRDERPMELPTLEGRDPAT